MTSMVPGKGATQAEIDDAVDAILAAATVAEKVGMMSGRGFMSAFREDNGVWGARPYRAGGGIDRLGIPPLYFTDGPRGVARGNSTCFPCTMARGATFDPELEHRVGEVMGYEARAQDCTLSGAVCVNLLRHPAWGRAQETYGEDSWHLGVMGAALGLGIQTHNVVATVKHFALNSMENARFTVDVRADERTLHEVYLPHFKFIIDAGVASVMSAYNKVNGEYCGQNDFLLNGILKKEWGFDGFVHSDWVRGVYFPYGAAAGLDVENPEPFAFGPKLLQGVENGTIPPSVIEEACRRILRTQFRFSTAEDPVSAYDPSLIAGEAHSALALEVAEKSAVLLENAGVLPLRRSSVSKLAVLGRLADMENTGDNGSSRVRPPYVITPLAGLRRYLGDDAVIHDDGSDLDRAKMVASSADAVVVVVGYTAAEEGEFLPGDIALDDAIPDHIPEEYKVSRKPRPVSLGGDRTTLELPKEHMALIKAAADGGKPVIVVIVAGAAVLTESWRGNSGAILQTFYAGMEGGTALARLLFGDVSPSGKLPFTVAKDADHYPFFDLAAKSIQYGYWHGYAKLDREGIEPRYAFGHGLSYASFEYRALKVRRVGDRLDVSLSVANTGAVAADEVVQCYIGTPGKAVERPVKSLRGFQRVRLGPGERRTVRICVPIDSLRWRDPDTHTWRLENGQYSVWAGGSSAALIGTRIRL